MICGSLFLGAEENARIPRDLGWLVVFVERVLACSARAVADSRPAEPGSNDRPCDCTREFRLVSRIQYSTS